MYKWSDIKYLRYNEFEIQITLFILSQSIDLVEFVFHIIVITYHKYLNAWTKLALILNTNQLAPFGIVYRDI